MIHLELITLRIHSQTEKDYRSNPKNRGLPWEFNDLLGFLQIGWDRKSRMEGVLFLKRKHFPSDRTDVKHQYKTTLQRQEVLRFGALNPWPVDLKDNRSCVEAVHKIVREAEGVIAPLGGMIQSQPYDLRHFDMASAIRGRR